MSSQKLVTNTIDKDINFAWACQELSFCPSLGHLYIDGKYKHLSPKVSAVLDLLCENSPHIINKLDILDIVWRHQEISDTAVADAIEILKHIVRFIDINII